MCFCYDLRGFLENCEEIFEKNANPPMIRVFSQSFLYL